MRKKLEQIAVDAGKIVREAVRKEYRIENKSGVGNYVTEIDVRIQEFLQSALCECWPEIGFMGEESESASDRPVMFCVDPIDGTANMIRNMDYSAVSIGCIDHGVPVCGVVYNPFTDVLYSAERGKGASRNGLPVRCTQADIAQTLLICGLSSYTRNLTDRSFRVMRAMYDASMDMRMLGSAALDICRVADGSCGGFYEFELQPWDYAAAACILTEAGGIIRTLDDEPLSWSKGGSVLAAPKEIYERMIDIYRQNR